MDELVSTLAIWALPVLFAITLHEAAHGYVARFFGDTTAEQAGRISLNPLRHVDALGTVVVPGFILLVSTLFGSGGLLFGWAKPVPVNFSRLRHPKSDMLWVALAGPMANLLMGFGWGLLLKLGASMPHSGYATPMIAMASAGIMINGVLMMLNLLPIPPLDGGRIVTSLLPHRLSWQFSRLEPYGFPILLLLLFSGLLGYVMSPLMGLYRRLISILLGF